MTYYNKTKKEFKKSETNELIILNKAKNPYRIRLNDLDMDI